MNLLWSLDKLYTGFESDEFKSDLSNFKLEIKKIDEWAKTNFSDVSCACEKIETFLAMKNSFSKYLKLIDYCTLVSSADSKNTVATKTLDTLEDDLTELTNSEYLFKKFLVDILDLESIINSSDSLKAHEFLLNELKEESKYMLSDKEEILLSKLKTTGSSSWTKLHEQLTSNLMIDIEVNNEKKQLPIALIRNFAYESDAKLRKDAYFAELKGYEKIDSSIAFSLNGIKGETINIAKLRGFKNSLDMTLFESRMDLETLNAMFSAIKDSLPSFRSFFKRKAELLGHKSGLPFYDLFAPLGSVDMNFTYPQAVSFVTNNFSDFSEKLGEFAKYAFKNDWIDVEPREGKRGGAFCSNLHSISESRILTNFTGSFSDVLTLAHELGHAYHGDCLSDQTFLNSDYSMPIAETASTLCETIVVNAALKTASKEESFVILENDITGMAQVVVDIYSRFLFEDEVFNRRENSSLTVCELKEIMSNAQKEAYGDGLDHNFLHPYMWLPKPHYYYADSNYYNFPYAYGLLFSKGLYSLYLEKGEDFIPLYDKLLKTTGKMNLRDVAKLVGIDTHDKAFWASSLKLIEDEILEFIKL